MPNLSLAMRVAAISVLVAAAALWPGVPVAGQAPDVPAREWRRLDGPVPAMWQEDVYVSELDIASNAAGTLVVLWWVEAERVEGPLWYSLDGNIWTEGALPGVATESLVDLVGSPDGFLAVGGDTVWWSADGIAWEVRSRIPGADVRHLAAAGDELVAIGGLLEQAGPSKIWTSGDAGVTWEQGASTESVWVERIAVSADGTIVMLVVAADPGEQDGHYELWTVIDGESFEVKLPGSRYDVSSLSWTEAGFIVTTDRSPKRRSAVTTLWRSPDGRAWTKVAAVDGYTDLVRDADGELLWFGYRQRAKKYPQWVATSTDGASWRFDRAAVFDEGTVTGVATVGDRVYATGTYWVDRGSYSDEFAALWVGERAADAAEPSPSPVVSAVPAQSVSITSPGRCAQTGGGS